MSPITRRRALTLANTLRTIGLILVIALATVAAASPSIRHLLASALTVGSGLLLGFLDRS